MRAVVDVPGFGWRKMTQADLPEILEIEFSAYRFPWSAGIFRDCMRVGYACWVYEEDDEVFGYGVMSIAAGECHLLNICVKPQYQGQGLGRRILRYLINIAHQHNVDTAILEVRPSNHRAINLYLSEGFGEVGRRRDYYPSQRGREDALILAKALSPHLVK
jgi:ribosomal-protein-alanine N-acetyltransferase